MRVGGTPENSFGGGGNSKSPSHNPRKLIPDRRFLSIGQSLANTSLFYWLILIILAEAAEISKIEATVSIFLTTMHFGKDDARKYLPSCSQWSAGSMTFAVHHREHYSWSVPSFVLKRSDRLLPLRLSSWRPCNSQPRFSLNCSRLPVKRYASLAW